MRCVTTAMICFVACGIGMAASGDEPSPGKQVACQWTVKTGQGDQAKEETIHYWLFLPGNYETQEAWPLMMFLHGAGERGDNLDMVKTWGPPKIVEQKTEFPFVLVSPQCPKGVQWNVDLIAQFTDHVAGTLKIDRRRMYITGLSMGGYGTWRILAKHPNLYAAAVPICGGGEPENAERMKHVPIWAFHGAKDRAVPLKASQQMVDAVTKAGGNAKLTVYPDADHNSWSQTYANPEVYQWLLSHKRAE